MLPTILLPTSVHPILVNNVHSMILKTSSNDRWENILVSLSENILVDPIKGHDCPKRITKWDRGRIKE